MARKYRNQIPLYCSGKRAYDKRGAITAVNNRFREDHVRLRIYPCHNHWHLTSELRGKPYTSKKTGGKRRIKQELE